jgi:alanyl-tRNA synthetase
MPRYARDQREKLLMKNMTSTAIRQSFLDFFESKGHLIVPSASLVPLNDPTLLFTNAGMNQFKDAFLGLSAPPASRVADTQKCMRVSGKHNDLEDVGPSPYHHTFFEMLGNWSFGDYYKKEAIVWAWELLTEVWGFPGERLYATVFKDEKGEIATDDEAAGYWRVETGMESDHVLFFGRKDNFWEMGETGPCGPCSEIHFDRGPEFCDKADVPGHKCQVNGDCVRFLEMWNLVFIQYNSHGEGHLEPLPARHVDTGAGFERLVMVMQGGDSNYDTDVFTPIFRRIQDLAGHNDQQVEQNSTPYRVIADHSRAAAFLIGDGVLPGNVGRGYVLRMVIRRAARFGRKLGFSQPFMAGVADAVIDTMGHHYRELRDRREHILQTITQEEERFLRTLDQGLSRLDQLLSQLPPDATTLPGDDAFDLYATYGLPLEITRDVAGEQGYTVDEDSFQSALEAHRDLSGGSMLESYGTELAYYAELLSQLRAEGKLEAEGVEHDPYSTTQMEVPVVALVRDGRRVKTTQPGDEVEVVLPATPFYVEAGGQVSDTGFITSSSTKDRQPVWRVRVTDMRRPVPGLVLHVGQVVEGQPREGDQAWAQVDVERRMDIMRNHTATHLLHRGLRQVLGSHVQQAGSLVAPDRLRFDFTHQAMLTREQLEQISHAVNEVILGNYPLHISHEPYDQALESGVIALFGEKYGDVVRVVRIGDSDELVSQELCGGTHVRETGEIGQFHIVSEGSVGTGLRRIEAVTGRAAERLVSDQLGVLEAAAAFLECQPEEVDQKVLALIDQSQSAHKEINRLRQELARRDFEDLMTHAQDLDGAAFLAARVKASQIETLRQMTDWFRDRYPSSVIVLGAVIHQRPQLVAAVTPDLVERGVRANELIKAVAGVIGGGGGGRPTLAQAGGRDADRLDEALSAVLRSVREVLGNGE